jgi:hypothetical protein
LLPTELNRAQWEGIIMKRTQLLVLSVLALGLQGVAQASPFPADAEASYNLPAISSYAEQHAGDTWTSAQSSFPADAEASYGMPGGVTHAEQHAGDTWTSAQSSFPADAEASYGMPGGVTHADRHAGDAVRPRAIRAQDVFAFRGNLDD